ncbi:MAG: phage tail protein [bacterium]
MADVLRLSGRIVRPVPFFGPPTEKYLDYNAEIIDPTKKFKKKPLRDFDFGSGEPFWPMPFAIGPECRVACRVTWVSPIKKKKITTSGGKGGGTPTESTSYKYIATLEVMVCEAPIGGIVDFVAIYADNTLIWGQDPDVDITDDELTATVMATAKHTYLDITSPIGGPDLSKFKTSSDVVMTGWLNAGNNITARVISRKHNADGTSTMRVRDDGDPSTVVDEAAGETVHILQSNVKFNANDSAAITFYKGTATQNPDPTIVAMRGAGNQSAHRQKAYVVIGSLVLNKFGGSRIPVFTAVVKAHTSITLPDAVDLLMVRGNVPPEWYDTTGLAGNVRGYTIDQPEAPQSTIFPLLVAHDILMQESGGVLRFFHRADADHVTVMEDQLSSRASGDPPPDGLALQRRAANTLPSEVNVNYRDPTNHLQARGERQHRNNYSVRIRNSIDLPLVMTSADARAIARRLLWLAWTNRHKASTSLPPSQLRILENDVVHVDALDTDWSLVATRVDQGQNGVIVLEANADDSGVVDLPAVDAGVVDTNTGLLNVPELLLEVLDIAAIGEAEIKVPGVYLAVALYDPSVAWPGAVAFGSADGVEFLPFASVEAEAIAGFAGDPLGTAIADVFDRANTLRVTLWNGELESVTREDALNGKNLAIVGTELIIFQTATLVAIDAGTGANVYELSMLLRGLRDTEDQIDTHVAGERFVLLSTVQFQQVTADILGKVRDYKAVANGAAEVDVSAVDEITHALQTLVPFAPQVIRTNPGGIRWRPRTRAFIDPFADADQQPLFEELNAFYVEVYQYIGGVEQWLYSSETVAGAGGSYEDYQVPGGDPLGNPLIFLPPTFTVQFRIFQKSTSVGRGKPAIYDVLDYA